MCKLTRCRRDKHDSSFREGRRGTRVLLGSFTIVCIASILLSCGNSGPDSNAKLATFEVGDIKSEYYGSTLHSPDLIQAVDEAFDKYAEIPSLENCTDLATWYRDGLEVVLDGKLTNQIKGDPTIDTARQVLVSVSALINGVMFQLLEADPSICSRTDYLRVLESLPETGPVAASANLWLETRGGWLNLSPEAQLGVALDLLEGVPTVIELNGFDYELETELVPNVQP